MKMKKITAILLSAMLSLLCWATACDGGATSGDSTLVAEPTEFSYFTPTKMNDNKLLKVFGRNETLSYAQLIAASCIQGLYAQNEVTYYYYSGTHNTALWLTDMVDNYGVTATDISFSDMVRQYKADYPDAGYILYNYEANNDSSCSVNVATVICAVKGWLPIEEKSLGTINTVGLECKADVRDVTNYTEEDCFNDYKDSLNNSALYQLKPAVINARDYVVANKFFVFYRNSQDTSELFFRQKVHMWVKSDAPVFGWGPINEHSHINFSSRYGQFTVASDWSFNLTVSACKALFGTEPLEQHVERVSVTAQTGKHYVVFCESDGDNIQALSNTLVAGKDYFSAEKGDFPMNWSISPVSADLQLGLMRYAYNVIGEKDCMIAAVSGTGFIYADQYPNLQDFCSRMQVYMKRADLHVTEIMTMSMQTDALEKIMAYYSQIEGLKGAIFKYGNGYSAFNGSVYWANDIPFVSFKCALDSGNVKTIAEFINSQPKTPDSIEGYTVVNVTPWSSVYDDVKKAVALLDEDVVVVNAEQFMELVTRNVPHENKILFNS